jgi:hypothetical protein
MRFIDTKFWKNYQKFDKVVGNSSTRCMTDAIGLFHLGNYHHFNNLLEIGIYQGLTLSLFYEINNNIEITGIDPNTKLDLVYSIHKDIKINHFVSFSEDVDYSKLGKFDLINIDGDHEASAVKQDIVNTVPLLNDNGILILDDFDLVDMIPNRKLLLEYGLVPFMQLEQCELYHYPKNDRSVFLDSFYNSALKNFLYMYNVDVFNHTVLKFKGLPVINDNLKICKIILEEYEV